jgi:hypothetical protein
VVVVREDEAGEPATTATARLEKRDSKDMIDSKTEVCLFDESYGS